MEEILDHLPAGARVLDLGSREGSFPGDDYSGLIILRVDITRPTARVPWFVQADAAALPFAPRTFDAVILNHSLEHFLDLEGALQQIGGVISREGAAFVAVPDARTIADWVYRKVYRNAGGHVNPFRCPTRLAEMLSRYFGLPHRATRTLCTGFNFLNRRRTVEPRLRGEMSFRGMGDGALTLLTRAFRLLDRWLHTRTTVYGWALYFGDVQEPIELRPRTNVCVFCGQGHPSDWLLRAGRVRRRWMFVEYYRCPACGTPNLFAPDSDFVNLT